MARLLHRPVRRPIRNDADARSRPPIDHSFRDEALRSLDLLRQTVHRGFVVFWLFRIASQSVVARPSREIRSHGMVGAWQGSIGDPVAVHVVVASPLAAELLEVVLREDLSALDRLVGIWERI